MGRSVYQSVLHGNGNRGRTVGGAELGEDRNDVALHRFLADSQCRSDLSVDLAAGHLRQYLIRRSTIATSEGASPVSAAPLMREEACKEAPSASSPRGCRLSM